MNYEIHYRPSNTALQLHLDTGDSIVTESGSMIAMHPNLEVETTTHKKGQKGGNPLKALKRLFAGESFFLNHYQAKGAGDLWLSQSLPGDIAAQQLQGESLIVQSSSFLAAEEAVDMNVGWQGFKSLFSGESLFWLNMKGSGTVFLTSFGSVYEEEIDGEFIVDSGHIVAFEETLNFSVSKVGSSWIGSFLSGEGLVCKFEGKGKVWCQSHYPKNFGMQLRPMLKPKRR